MKELNTMNVMFSNLSISIKLSLFCRHDGNWMEHKTKIYYTLWCLQKGELVLEINGKVLNASAGDIIFFYPGDTYKAHSQTGCCFLVFFFIIEVGNNIDLFKNRNFAGIYHGTKLKKKCHSFCEHYLRTYDNNSGMALELYADFLMFFSHITDFTEQYENFYSPVPAEQDIAINAVITYMKKHFTEKVSMKELAEIADMSEKYFISYFHFHMGIPPKQFMVELRMKHAVHLLSNTDTAIADIAEQLGYADQYCFSKAFKKFYGESPSSFRATFS